MRVAMALSLLICLTAFGVVERSFAAESRSDPVASHEVIEASKTIVAAFGADDPATYFALFDPEATFIFHTTQNRLENRAAYEEEWASWRRDLGFRVESCASSNQLVQMFGSIAVLTHSVQTEITTHAGTERFDERETIVFHRINGQWLAVHEHLSPRPAPL